MNPGPLPDHLPPPPLSRTSSSTSFSSEDDASMSSSTVTVISSSRRTRKRFTNVQLTMLENLFHQNSHPSREDREAVAKAGGMEIKSVTIWFQNKRQTERKTAASNNSNGNEQTTAVPHMSSTIHTFSLHNDSHSTSRTASPPFSISSSRSTSASATTTSSRPSLDRVASRSELRVAAPRTPSRRHNPSGAIWDSMPSSPLAPPISPPAREFIDFGKNAKTRRTLEWACAAARVADKDGYASGMTAGFGAGSGSAGSASVGAASASASAASSGQAQNINRGRTVHRERSNGRLGKDIQQRSRKEGSARRIKAEGSSNSMDIDMTDEEDHEAITPPSTWGKGDPRWMSTGEGSNFNIMALTTATGGLPKGIDDDDMFKAALALCGLGRRT